MPNPHPRFTVLPQSPTHIRIVHCNQYCIDIHCCANNMVSVRDGAYGVFQTSNLVEGLTAIQGLKVPTQRDKYWGGGE